MCSVVLVEEFKKRKETKKGNAHFCDTLQRNAM